MPTVEALTAQFQTLGVPNPELWAKSQIEEGIDQIGRATMLRAMADVAAEASARSSVGSPHVTEAVGAAAARIDASGAAWEDVELLVKSEIWEAFFGFLSMLAGAREIEVNPGKVYFGLYRTDEYGEQPSGNINMLHESWREVASSVLGQDIVAY